MVNTSENSPSMDTLTSQKNKTERKWKNPVLHFFSKYTFCINVLKVSNIQAFLYFCMKINLHFNSILCELFEVPFHTHFFLSDSLPSSACLLQKTFSDPGYNDLHSYSTWSLHCLQTIVLSVCSSPLISISLYMWHFFLLYTMLLEKAFNIYLVKAL